VKRASGLVRALGVAAIGLATLLARPATLSAAPSAQVPARGTLTKAPILVHFVEATYPPGARAAGLTATVKLRIAIDDHGEVTAVEIVESAGADFDAAALAAAKQFVFEPAEIDGERAPVKVFYAYAFTLQEAPPTEATFSGTIRDRATRAPLAGVTLSIDGKAVATTDASGHFQAKGVAPGKHAIAVDAPGLTTVFTEETFEAGRELRAVYALDPPAPEARNDGEDLEVVVVAPPLVKAVTSVEVPREEARRVPGTQGDVLKVVQNLPGVARAPTGSGQLVVWGSAPEDTRVYVDEIRVPLLYHFSGVRSTIASDLVRSVELVPGGYGAAYGRGLGGLVLVKMIPLEDDTFHGSASTDLLDFSASARGGIGERFRAAAGLRYGWLDKLVPLVTHRDVGELFPVPAFFDAQLRVAVFPSPRTSVELGGLASSDAIERTVASADPAATSSDRRTLRWGRVYARYRTELEDGTDVTVVPWLGRDVRSLVDSFGDVRTSVSSAAWIVGLRASYRSRLVDHPEAAFSGLTITLGMDGEMTQTAMSRDGSIGAPAREGDRAVFGEAPSGEIASDAWTVWSGSPAVFGEADAAFFKGALHVVPGIRVDPYFTSTSRRTPISGDTPSVGLFTQEPFLEPRIAIRARAADRIELRAAYGHYHQPPAADDLSAVFGTPTLESSSAHHLLAGANVQLAKGINVDVVGYFTKSSALAIRSSAASPLLAHALAGTGVGRSFGAQFLVRMDRQYGFFGWISYGVSRSERAPSDDGPYRAFDFDQAHVLTVVASYDVWKGLEVGARFRLATGFPRTPVTGAYYDAKSDAYRPLFGATNSVRLPLFYQLDIRVSKTFRVGSTELEGYLDVQNVTNHDNLEERVYSADYSKQGAITGIPFLPVIGVKSSW
jgi:TonB family protein